MTKMKKIALIAVCAMLLVCVTIGATVAYLTSNDKVVNTFTVGKVAITLDEAPVEPDGTLKTGPRVDANAYHLLPGKSYQKDPIVHVDKNSEDCYVFVKVENGIAALEADSTEARPNIAAQIESNGWTVLDGVTNVYYQEYKKTDPAPTKDVDLPVFAMFTISENADASDAWASVNANTKVTVTAYAIQKDGFANVAAAWAEVSK